MKSAWLEQRIADELGGRAENELAETDWRSYRYVQELRTKLAAARVYERYDTDEQAVQLVHIFNDPKARETVANFNARVDLAEFNAAMAKAIDAVQSEHLCRCEGCHKLLKYSVLHRVQNETLDLRCLACVEEVWSRPNNPPEGGIFSALARARSRGLPATLTKEAWELVIEHFEDRCAYCGMAWCLIEHATPLERGGPTTLDNCVPACGSCNRRKGSMTLEEYIAKKRVNQARVMYALSWLQQHGRPC